jgi:hypothetical protein
MNNEASDWYASHSPVVDPYLEYIISLEQVREAREMIEYNLQNGNDLRAQQWMEIEQEYLQDAENWHELFQHQQQQQQQQQQQISNDFFQLDDGYNVHCNDLRDTCSICMMPLNDGSPKVRLNPCGHCNHYDCIFAWLNTKRTDPNSGRSLPPSCPLCRSKPVSAQLFIHHPRRQSV